MPPALWGRVVRGNEPVVDASVIASAGGKRAAFTCTDSKGGFKLEVPAGQAVMLSIVLKDGSEAFRDRDGDTLQPGQVAFREIDLAGVARPARSRRGSAAAKGQPPSPAPPTSAPPARTPAADDTPPATPPKDDSFPMVQLVGQLEPDAQKLIKAQGLLLGERSTKVNVEQAGRVIEQKPVAGAKVRPGDTVAIAVATDDKVDVPSRSRHDAEGRRGRAAQGGAEAGQDQRRLRSRPRRPGSSSTSRRSPAIARRASRTSRWRWASSARVTHRDGRSEARARRRSCRQPSCATARPMRKADRSRDRAVTKQRSSTLADLDKLIATDRTERARQARDPHARRDRPHDRGAEEGAQGAGRVKASA